MDYIIKKDNDMLHFFYQKGKGLMMSGRQGAYLPEQIFENPQSTRLKEFLSSSLND